MLISTLLELVGIGIIPIFISLAGDLSQMNEYPILNMILKDTASISAKQFLIFGGIILVLVFLLKNSFSVFNYFLQQRFARHLQYKLSKRLFRAYLNAPYTFHLQVNSADILRNVQQEILIIAKNLTMEALASIMEIIILIAVFSFLFYEEPKVSAISLGVLGVAAFGFNFFSRKRLLTLGKILQNERSDQVKAINQGLGSVKDTLVNGRQSYFENYFKQTTKRLVNAYLWIGLIQRSTNPFLEIIAISGMMIISILLVLSGKPVSEIAPALGFFGVAILRLKQSFSQLLKSYTGMKANYVAINPVYDDLMKLESISKTFQAQQSIQIGFNNHGNISLKNISFYYPSTEIPALKDISLEIKKGQAVAFVGTTGSGKTTLVDIILGLLRPQHGDILVDKISIWNNLRSWQSKIGYIPQHIYLIDDTIKRNIAFGIDEKDIDEKNVWKALEAAQLHSFIRSLENGLNTQTGERGIRLSGGQRQRIGIARALYNNPEILIMDEATSALDNKTEKSLIQAIEKLKSERTIIMIAHRLSSVRNCDCLYLLKDGQIVDFGSYDELLEKNKEFRTSANIK